MKKKYKINKIILSETKNLMRSFTFVQDDNQSGRSMVEMLGVLAIIGVLSVGGIAGYISAMRQYKANEIVNATSMLYMMGASQNQGNGDKQMLYSGALGTVPSGVSEITYKADKTITLAFTDTDVCPLVKNKLGDKATGECPTLTVSFGEVASEPEEEEEVDEDGISCKSHDKYACGNGNYGPYTIKVCVAWDVTGIPSDRYQWSSGTGTICPDGCKDNKVHDNMEDTCIAGNTQMLE